MDSDILTLFKEEGEKFDWKLGFNSTEIHNLGPKSLEVVVGTLITDAKRLHKLYITESKMSMENRYEYAAMSMCDQALNVFNTSEAKHLLKDRSIVFPAYSFMLMLIKSGAYTHPNNHQTMEEYECEMASNFLKETTFNQYHHCRALAMKIEIMAKHSNYEDAMDSLNIMRQHYDPHVHSKVLMEVYVSDHCGDVIAASIQWLHYHLNQTEEAMVLCVYILEVILPVLDEKEFISLSKVLIPIARLYKDQGEEQATKALELYDKHIFNPMSRSKDYIGCEEYSSLIVIILKCKSLGRQYDGMKDNIAFLLDDNKDKVIDNLETVCFNYFEWCMSSMASEACLLVAKKLDDDEQEQETRSQLIEAGLGYAEMAERTMKDEDGNIISEIAYSSHPDLVAQLESLNSPV